MVALRKNKTLGAKVSYEEYGLIYQRAGQANKTVSLYIRDLILSVPEPKKLEQGGNVAETDVLKKQITTLQEQLKTAQAATRQNDGLAKEYADFKKQSQKVVEEAIIQEKTYQKQIAQLKEETKELTVLKNKITELEAMEKENSSLKNTFKTINMMYSEKQYPRLYPPHVPSNADHLLNETQGFCPTCYYIKWRYVDSYKPKVK